MLRLKSPERRTCSATAGSRSTDSAVGSRAIVSALLWCLFRHQLTPATQGNPGGCPSLASSLPSEFFNAFLTLQGKVTKGWWCDQGCPRLQKEGSESRLGPEQRKLDSMRRPELSCWSLWLLSQSAPPTPLLVLDSLRLVAESSNSGEIMSDTSADAVLRKLGPGTVTLFSRMILQVQWGQGSTK